jgi:hypothetical protein
MRRFPFTYVMQFVLLYCAYSRQGRTIILDAKYNCILVSSYFFFLVSSILFFMFNGTSYIQKPCFIYLYTSFPNCSITRYVEFVYL